MRFRARAAAWLGVIVSLAAGAALRAQTVTISVATFKADSISPAPAITVSGENAPPEGGPYAVQLELAADAAFSRRIYANLAEGLEATFRLDSLLAAGTNVFFRARLFANGQLVAEKLERHPVQAWVQLISPEQLPFVPLNTQRPRFVWQSPPITAPPGVWDYLLTIINTRTNLPAAFAGVTGDTSFVLPEPLETNTSYRWQVRARGLNNRGSTEFTARSTGSFSINDLATPTFTIFYQNFPNPFGRGERESFTCFWFDLAQPAKVQLTIYTLNLRLVRHVVPGSVFGRLPLDAGAYGRAAMTGCPDETKWDGRDDSGKYVPAGVYIAEFRAGNVRTTKKLFFKGPP